MKKKSIRFALRLSKATPFFFNEDIPDRSSIVKLTVNFPSLEGRPSHLKGSKLPRFCDKKRIDFSLHRDPCK